MERNSFISAIIVCGILCWPQIGIGENASDLPGYNLFYGSNQCAFCHNFGGGNTSSGPDLLGVTERRTRDWLTQWLSDPASMIISDPIAQQLVAEYNNVVMPKPAFTSGEIQQVIDFLVAMDNGGSIDLPVFEPLNADQFEIGKAIYFDRCSGCHGAKRWGATGPSLLPGSHIKDGLEVVGGGMAAIGTTGIEAIIYHGSPAGMPAWGREGILAAEEINILARFLQMMPPPIPAFSKADAEASWENLIPISQRPTQDQTGGKFLNYFGVVLRDAGQVAIVDGDTKSLVAVLDTGKAVHILRPSKSGRYLYAIARDGRLALIDLWSAAPKIVARVRACWDARSVDSSKAPGFLDKYAIVGCYSPGQYVIVNGETLEPISVNSVSDSTDWQTCNKYPEVRIAAIVASEEDPYWVITLKESGWIYFADYSTPNNPKETRLRADNFLHDGGWIREEGSSKKRYLMFAANAKNKMCVVDTRLKQVQQPCIETGAIPHPGRGANFVHPTYGRVWATAHIGQGKLSVIGVDPVSKPQYAWKVVSEISLKSAGSLFIKSHPNSKHLWVDFPLSSVDGVNGQVAVYNIETGSLNYLTVSDTRIVHMDYNKAGNEVWISGWMDNKIYVYDDATLSLKQTITGSWIKTPTGKFNVYNTIHDIY